MKRILISAYACEPNKGSEPEVGWQWVLSLAKYNKLWVFTKANNQKNIEDYFKNNKFTWLKNITFVYIDLPKCLTFWKKGNRGIHLYYKLWQKKAYNVAKRMNKEIKFDIVHSVTFVSYTQCCYWDKLKIPFVWTIAGGENISKRIKYPMKFNEKLYEKIRKIGQLKYYYSFRTRKLLKNSNLILAATNETKNALPTNIQKKVEVCSAIGINKINSPKNYSDNLSKIRILVSGKFTYLKGMDIAIKVLVRVLENYDNVIIDVLGNGKKETELKKLCKEYYDSRIFFIDKIDHEKIYDFYRNHDILLNTALRDSGCLVVLEAMSVGLPIVCVDTGGVRELTTNKNAIKIAPCEYEELVGKLYKGLEHLILNTELIKRMGENSYRRTLDIYTYDNKAKWLNKKYNEILGIGT